MNAARFTDTGMDFDGQARRRNKRSGNLDVGLKLKRSITFKLKFTPVMASGEKIKRIPADSRPHGSGQTEDRRSV